MNQTCYGIHQKHCVSCDDKKCKNWIDYEEDLNCAVICARKNQNGLSLRDVALRMGVSFPRVSQIENEAMKKIKKRKLLDF